VPGWGDDHPAILILGLAPAAHGGNRTGRIFTGDRSGDVLFASLYRTGLAAQPTSVRAGDGQRLLGARMSAAVRCAPPANKPDPAERDACAPWLAAELVVSTADLLRVIVCLGGFAWRALWPHLTAAGWAVPRPRPSFGHGAEVRVSRPSAASAAAPPTGSAAAPPPTGSAAAPPPTGSAAASPGPLAAAGGSDRAALVVLGCYHPSQQNTFTGRVTPAMLDDIFARAAQLASTP
jgi:uracil-DNA glycosylase family 4